MGEQSAKGDIRDMMSIGRLVSKSDWPEEVSTMAKYGVVDGEKRGKREALCTYVYVAVHSLGVV